MKAALLLSVSLLLPLVSPAQTDGTDWFTSTFLGSLWRGDAAMPLGDSSFVEPELRPLLPSVALEDLRFARHPHGAALAGRLAALAGISIAPPGIPSSAISTDSLMSLLSGTAHQSVDVESYLRLRLFDHLIGDWSRTEHDIVWLQDNQAAAPLWRPVPKPFQNAFTRYNGLLPWIMLQMSDQMTSWSADPTRSLRNTNPLRFLDRRFLSSLSWSVWDSVTAALISRFDQGSVRHACDDIPPPGKELLSSDLQQRMLLLPVLAQQYYRSITRFVEFHSNGQADSVFIRILSKQALEVSINGNDGPARLLNSLATREVRFLMMNDSNSLWIEGPDQLGFDLIVDVGESRTGIWRRRHPLERWSPGAPGNAHVFRTPRSEGIRDRDDAWGQRFVFVPWIDANRDDHLFLGGGPEITTSAYRLSPFATRTTILAGIATRTERFRIMGSFESRSLVRGMGFGLDALYSQLNISNFFGLGNETEAPEQLLSRSFFKADQRLFELSAPIRLHISDDLSLGFLPALHMLRTEPRPGSLIDSLISGGYARQLNYTSLRLHALYDSRDRSAIPSRGMFMSAAIAWFPRVLQNAHSFASVQLDSRYYQYLGRDGMHLLFRTNGEAVFGKHPWFESAFIGGSQTLRGFERQRFAGDAAVSGSLEWRVPFGRVNVFWPIDIGGILFGESGRVFTEGETSKRWHSSVGAGAWFHPARSPYSVVVSVAASKELVEFLATFGVPVR